VRISTFFAVFLQKKSNFVAQMREIQFAALVLTILLTIKLLVLPRHAISNHTMSTARWLMAGGTSLLCVQFLLQYTLQLRTTGHVYQAIMLNLALFIPCSALLSLAVLYLQRQGRVSRIAKFIGLPVWVLAMALIAIGIQVGGEDEGVMSSTLKWAEVGASACYAVMQLYYSVQCMHEMRRIRQAMDNYYDNDMDHLIQWMQLSIIVLTLMAALIPVIIFGNGLWLAPFALLIFGCVFYLVDSFCLYAASSAPARVCDAEENASHEDEERREVNEELTTVNGASEPTDDVLQHVEEAVNLWVADGSYLRSGIKMPVAAEAIGVPRYLLSAWLKKRKNCTYASWMNNLRIDAAKRVLTDHPDWNNEAVAQHCGFSDRSYFQKKFKEATGLTPADYLETTLRGFSRNNASDNSEARTPKAESLLTSDNY